MKQRVEQMKKWIRQQVPEGGKAIIGISGGKDSTVAAALCVEALGKENVIGVMMPNGHQKDIADSHKVCDLLGITGVVINIEKACDSLYNSLSLLARLSKSAFPEIITTNTPARIRMVTLYMVAGLFPNSRVVNTCNYSEDYVGYSTKYGDAAGDFSPLGNLTVREVLAVGDFLGLPYDLVHKTPSDGMCGKSDEEKLGFTYEQLDDYILHTRHVDIDIVEKIEKLHRATRHKYMPIPTFCDWEEE